MEDQRRRLALREMFDAADKNEMVAAGVVGLMTALEPRAASIK